jgi:regulator of replication initiation timing
VFQFEKESQFEDTVQSYHQEIRSLKNELKKLQSEKEDLNV